MTFYHSAQVQDTTISIHNSVLVPFNRFACAKAKSCIRINRNIVNRLENNGDFSKMDSQNKYRNVAAVNSLANVRRQGESPNRMPLQLNLADIDAQVHQYNEDSFPPPSPVSSSYSELRRATENHYPSIPIYPSTSQHPNHTYANIYQSDYTYASYQPNHSHHAQISSPYESIYEPISSRPTSQMSNRSNFPTYSNGGSISGSTAHLGPKPMTLNGATKGNYREAEVDVLTELLVQSMNMGGDNSDPENFGTCVQCGNAVVGENSGCTAMQQIYHIDCFKCCQCQINLQGKPFYALEGKPCCEEDYLNTLEKCSVCMKPILERILRANGKPYHPKCFCCVVCGKSLDSVPFTVDATNQNHCIEDFHKKFAPRCCVCKLPIMPEPGNDETVRVVALDRSFHVACYKCEDCDLLLSTEAEGRGCYPMDDHILCKACNAKRIQMLTSHMTTEL